MTLPDERYRAVRMARQFLQELMDPQKTPKVPAIIRSQARGVLRHYPSDYEMNRAAEASPDIFQTEMEPVYRMIKKYEQTKDSKDEA
jgi:hypothetical protein